MPSPTRRAATLAHAIIVVAAAAPAPAAAQPVSGPPTAPPAARPATRLTLGRPVAGVLAEGATHAYTMRLAAGRFVYAEADQRSVDVAVSVHAPDGARVGVFDGPGRGVEPVQFTTGTAGDYRIVVRAFGRSRGEYALVVRRMERPAASSVGRMRQLMTSLDRADVPGGVVVVVRGGRTLFARGYGLANVEHRVANTPRTPFHVASVSKQFTAFAVALLADEGRLSLDDDVRRYVPELPPTGATITLRHLVHHTSGLRDAFVLWEMAGGRGDDAVRQEDLLRLVARQGAHNFTPGAEYDYTNTGYLLLAEVVARVTGATFRDWMRTHVFLPLGMRHTQVVDDHERIVPGRAASYEYATYGVKQQVLSSGSTGATGVVTTAEDLVAWLRNWKVAAVGGTRVRAMMEERGVLTSGDTIRYAFGVNVSRFRGLRRLEHGGFQAGFRSLVAYYPEIDGGVIVLGNTPSFNATGLAGRVAEIFFGDHMEPPSPGTPPGPRPPAPAAAPPDSPSAYVGRYDSAELETTYTVATVEGRLVVRHWRLGEVALVPDGADRFRGATWMFGTVEFERDAAGRVATMRVTPSNERVRRLAFARRLE